VRPVSATLGIVWIMACACGDSRERDRVDFERMRLQQRYDVYQTSEVFANGAVVQPPPVGTVARETVSDTGSIGSGLIDGRAVTVIPVSVTPALLALGQRKFGIYCAVCHGPAAFGGSLVALNMGPPRPPSLRSAAAVGLPPGYIFDIVTHGQGRMPSYAPDLSAAERWAVVAYLQQLQRGPATGPAATEDSLRALEIRPLAPAARLDSTARGVRR
jgi:mono/diheme cytochrome c family protein